MDSKDWKQIAAGLWEKAGAYKYALLVGVIGLILLLWPQSGEKTEQQPALTPAGETTDFSVEQLEEKLETALGKIAGVGQVTVVLYPESGVNNIYATDRAMGREDREESLVILSGPENEESALLVKQFAPLFRGALIICEGGGNPQIKLQITEAVSALTGLGADRISVCKGN